MSWATSYIADLKAGKTVKFRPKGNSMSGRVESGQLVTVEPATPDAVQKGDVVLCKVNGSQYLHLVKAKQGNRCLIGNNKGKTNGWTTAVFGKLISVSP